MPKISQTKMGASLSYVMMFLSNILGLVLVNIMIKSLGSEINVYNLIGSLAAVMLVMDFGMSSTTSRYVAKYQAQENHKQEENFIATSLIVYAVISVMVIIIGISVSAFIDDIYKSKFSVDELNLAKTMFLILVGNLALSLPLNCFSGIMNGYENFVLPRVLSIIRVLVRFTLIVVLLNSGYKTIMIVIVDTILNLSMQFIIMLYVLFKMRVKIKLHKFDFPFLKEISAFSVLIFLTMVYDQIFWKVDQMIVGKMISPDAVSICAFGVMLNTYYMRFSTAISEVFLPRVTAMVTKGASGRALSDFMIKLGRIQLLVLSLVLCGVILFGRNFYHMWTGDFTDTSYLICIIIMIPLTIPLIQNTGIAILRAMNKHAFRSKVYFIIAIANIFATILMVRYIGILGAPIATALSLTVGNIIIINIYYNKVIGIEVMRFFKETILKFLPLIAVSLAAGFLITNFLLAETILSMILCIVLFTTIYIVLAYLMTMNDYEKQLALRAIKKIKKIIGGRA